MENIRTSKKTGSEKFLGANRSLLDFWAWAHSDIASNAERGILAEYIVNCALQTDNSHRIEWDSVDAISPEGIKVEVKSAAYLQTWKQNKLSYIQFDISPKKSWNSKTNQYSERKCRSADVYVFCLFASTDPKTANPLDLSQWEFYILKTSVLDARIPLQKTISLNVLIKLGAERVEFDKIYAAVKNAAEK